MQTVSTQFASRAAGSVRPLSWALFASFMKTFDDTVTFFEIGVSDIAGGDFIAPEDSDVVQEWDKYNYEDYSDRVLSLEWTQEAEEPSGVTSAMADIELNNYDKKFSPGVTAIKQVAILESPETWSDSTDNFLNVVQGVGAKKVTVGTSAIVVAQCSNASSLPLDLTAYAGQFIRAWVYVTGYENLHATSGVTIRFRDGAVLLRDYNITSQIKGNGPQYVQISLSTYTQSVGFNPSNIAAVSLRVQTSSSGGSTVTIDDIKIVNKALDFLGDYILPNRPFRLYAGFSGENVPQFVGVNDKMPDIDETARFHLIDFLATLMNRDINESVILENVFTDEVLDYFFQLVGLSSTQYVLDHGFNLIDFVYVESGTNLGTFLRKLMEAEQGRLYMDELGIIRFKNRQNYSDTAVMSFDESNVISYVPSNQDKIINTVEIKSNVRSVLANQKYWELAFDEMKHVVPPGGTVTIWAEFNDPVTSVDDPEYITSADTSLYTTNVNADGSGANLDAYIALDSISKFATSSKMVFLNSHPTSAIYITTIELFATPAKVTNEIFTRQSDAVSVGKYDEQMLRIENDYIPNETEAISKAIVMIEDYKELGDMLDLNVKGSTALQIGDPVDLDLDGYVGIYVISKIVNRYANARFTQILTVRQKDVRTYFRIEESDITGPDQIAP